MIEIFDEMDNYDNRSDLFKLELNDSVNSNPQSYVRSDATASQKRGHNASKKQVKFFEDDNPDDEEFDYKKHVELEMQRMNVGNVDPQIKKKIVQKIRNRISASRSRTRQKNTLKRFEEENCILRKELARVYQRCRELEKENAELKTRFCSTDHSVNTKSAFIYDSPLTASPQITHEYPQNSDSLHHLNNPAAVTQKASKKSTKSSQLQLKHKRPDPEVTHEVQSYAADRDAAEDASSGLFLNPHSDGLSNESSDVLQNSLTASPSSFFRERTPNYFDFNLNSPKLFMCILIFGVIFIAQRPSGNQEQPLVRMAGVVPAIASSIPPSSTQLRSMEQVCQKYCQAANENNCLDYLNFLKTGKEIMPQYYVRADDWGRGDGAYSKLTCRAEEDAEANPVLFVKRQKNQNLNGAFLVSGMQALPMIEHLST